MKFNWEEYLNKMINVTLKENYGMVFDAKNETPLYEIVFKSGRLTGVYEEGLLLETAREQQQIKIYIPYSSIKCVEIFNI